ncbi:Pc13g15270 [Penicillium rubens Wisconsin 54-1255]|uniref:Pc13g15270 protein n=1 Tax=Penicillium rubens (strain ATCC 28089 / DSM 1075 / NRRL 1951 / Wisconsin 54-1255) TaxID=500485 RepID=B6H2S8_PENRW|nr:Pc13g15270 [Penicillium rubens Wisconsin 54-1255]
MSRRTLGGGRVLGNPSALTTPSPQPKRVLSPTASSVSLNSQAASQLSTETQDLTSRISIENGESSISTAPAAPGAELSCPICSEQMVCLFLCRIYFLKIKHLDDIHQNLEDSHQDEVKDWFKVQMEKARKFQPLAVLNQKLKGLDVFESNENQSASLPSRPLASHAGVPEPPRVLDPEDLITREHWQTSSMYDECLEPSCGKRLNATNGCVNCRSCGKLFCEEHTMYQMKLSRSAHHEPVRGIWARVCETCYKSREGYNDHNGTVRNQTDAFKSIRKQTVDKEFLEISRLEKRLTRLTQLLASLPPDQIHPSATKLFSLAWQNDQRKEIEQTIVSWQDDASVSRCPFCQQDFSGYTFRRHHCRTCGRVVCGDPSTECSSEVGLSIAPGSTATATSEKTNADNLVNIDVRLCKECKATLFDRRDFKADMMRKPPETRAYENLTQFERGIRLHLPRFQKLLAALQDPRRPPSSAQIADASKVRKRLIDSFAQYDVAARRIRDMPTQSPTQQKLQKAIYQQASNFLHLHMLPLKSLPKILKHTTPASERIPSRTSSPSTPVSGSTAGLRPPESALSSIKYNSVAASGSNTSLSSNTSSAVSALEAEEKSLRDRLIVLEEQKFFVSEMIADANRRRKFDEVSSLAMNVEDLSREIDRVSGMLASLDFEGVYTGNLQPTS